MQRTAVHSANLTSNKHYCTVFYILLPCAYQIMIIITIIIIVIKCNTVALKQSHWYLSGSLCTMLHLTFMHYTPDQLSILQKYSSMFDVNKLWSNATQKDTSWRDFTVFTDFTIYCLNKRKGYRLPSHMTNQSLKWK